MNALLQKLWSDLRSSYWFIPTLLVIGAVVLAITMLWIDSRVDERVFEDIPGLQFNQTDAARDVVSTVATAMITVASIVFSMTLVAVSHASTQFGPRLVSNFMRDRGNQFSLGIFVATYVYCLLILRSISSGEPNSTGPESVTFIPNLSIAVVLLLAITGVGLLIYYMHHVAESIRLSTIISRIGRDLHDGVSDCFPGGLGDPLGTAKLSQPGNELRRSLLKSSAHMLTHFGSGFIQTIDGLELFELTKKHDLTIELLHRPGEFISSGQAVAKVVPSDRVDDELAKLIQSQFTIGVHRTPDQNNLFLAEQLAEVATRALSPGVNDPRTAIDCLNWLQNVLFHLRQYDDPDGSRVDQQGHLRIIATSADYAAFARVAFVIMRPYFEADPNATRAMKNSLEFLIENETREDRIRLLREYRTAMQ